MSPNPTKTRRDCSKSANNVAADVISSSGDFKIADQNTEMATHNALSSSRKLSEKLNQAPCIEGLEALRGLEDAEGPEVVDFFRVVLSEGTLAPGDSGVPIDDRPSWLDERKLRLGQRFAYKFFPGLMMAELLSLFLLFASPGSLQPLIFSSNSHTPAKAYRRYLSTVRRVRAWYSGDLWAKDGEAGRHLRAVRHMHALYRRRLRDEAPAERARRLTLQPPLLTRGSAGDMRRDFAPLAAAAADTLCPFFSAIALHREWLNQMEMTLTQWGFVGLMVTYPQRFGASSASEEELEGFVHLWRAVGHLLGVDERYNFCNGGLDAVRKRTRVLLDRFMLPALAHVSDDWEHMSRCVVEGMKALGPPISFEVALLYLCETVGAETPNVLKSLSSEQMIMYGRVVWVMQWVLRLAPMRTLLGWRLRRAIDNAPSPPPDTDDELQAEVEAKPTPPKEEVRRADGPPMWLYTAVFALLTLVQIAIAVVWASQKHK